MQLIKEAITQRVTSLFPHSYNLHEEYGMDYTDGHQEEHQLAMWKTERIELKSVGIDIGSSTTHLMFSRLVLRRLGFELSSRFVVVSREVVWKSDILLTPYRTQQQIDVEKLLEFLKESYNAANLSPDLIDTGAVIITGEASRKENAEAITNLFSNHAGKFVCATAGPNLEAMMAAYGCGAVRKSLEATNKIVMVVDVGGGTVKIAVVQDGAIRDTVAINIGSRLVALDDVGHIIRIEEAGKAVAMELGIKLQIGRYLKQNERNALAARMTEVLFDALGDGPLSPLTNKLMITPPLHRLAGIDLIMFSGGVGEYVYGTETRDYGDLGPFLGRHIRDRLLNATFGIPMEIAEERIRATVIGASQFTIQLSGSTIFISNEHVLPIRNLKVISPKIFKTPNNLTSESVERAIKEAFDRFDLVEGEEPVALSFEWFLEPRYEHFILLSKGIASALKNSTSNKQPIVLVFNSDIGKSIGRLLKTELHLESEVVSIDQVHLHDFDYIDIGQIVKNADAVPVVVKSLIFGKPAEEALKQKPIRVIH